ncbi:MAG TPA: hypothetical protein DGZ24_07800 [Rhodospirillaceae bacterium]|nr:hypothetical protein [Rhodospirillaceae bacterium]
MGVRKKSRRTIAEVVEMTAAYFNLDVEVWIEIGKLKDNMAEAEDHGAGVYTLHFDKKFIKEDDEAELVKAAAHEMVHVKQFELDGLRLEENIGYMNGAEHNGDYWFSPREIEATGYQDAFLHHYFSGK